jgi:hypothetical protein
MNLNWENKTIGFTTADIRFACWVIPPGLSSYFFVTRVISFISWFMQLWRVNWKKLKIFDRKRQDGYGGWDGEEEVLADRKKCSIIFL